MSKKVCLITGASRGIGHATAQRFARDGYRIAAVARGEAALHALRDELAADGHECLPLAADLSKQADCERVVAQTVQEFGRLDVVVNNAGTAVLGKLEELSADDYRQMMALNCDALFYLVRAAWPVLRAAGGGVVVNVSSVSAQDPFAGLGTYGATKGWVNVFTKAIAAEGRPDNIRVYAIAPGAVETPLLRSLFPDIPSEACLQPDEVADAIAAACGDGLRFATGETIYVKKG